VGVTLISFSQSGVHKMLIYICFLSNDTQLYEIFSLYKNEIMFVVVDVYVFLIADAIT